MVPTLWNQDLESGLWPPAEAGKVSYQGGTGSSVLWLRRTAGTSFQRQVELSEGQAAGQLATLPAPRARHRAVFQVLEHIVTLPRDKCGLGG